MSDPLYVVGDVHGQIGALEAALAFIETDGGPDAEIVFLGDYLDRGSDSRGVVDRLMQGQAAGKNWITLKGNHDRYLTRFLADPHEPDPASALKLHWFNERIGGRMTMKSYGVDADEARSLDDIHADALQAVPKSHRDWIEGLLLCHERPDMFLAHAGIEPGVPLDRQTEDTLLWIREPFLSWPDPHPKLIVHGHTVQEFPRHFGNRINLDGGAGYGRPIYPAVFEGTDCWLLSADGRQPLRP